ncbi:MAG: PDZ domain-containing protein, partial [Fuerstiella sp.]
IEMLTCGRSRNTAVGFSQVTVDRQLDLVFVKLHESTNVSNIPSVPPSGVSDSAALSIGGVVYGGPEASIGIVARTDHRETAVTPRLGVELLFQSGSIIVEKVNPLGAASDAELVPGDRLVKLAGTDLEDLDDVADVLSSYQPGDLVVFDVERDEQKHRRIGRLTFPADSLLQRENFLDGRAGELSRRRTGFSGVMQHDVNLSPSQMGGPLVNSQGQWVGVNIARRGRESVLAIPVGRFAVFLTSLTR